MPQVRRYHDDGPVRRTRTAKPARHAPQRRKRAGNWGMKLGAWAHARMRQAAYSPNTGKAVMAGLAVTAFGLFVLVAALTGQLSDMRRAVDAGTAGLVRSAGFGVAAVDVATVQARPLSVFQQAEARAVAAIPYDAVMFTLDMPEIRNRVSSLPWVENVAVRRLWPGTVQILITPREATAVWQHEGRLQLIDGSGRVLRTATPAQARGMPLLMGAGAPAHAPTLFTELTPRPEVAKQTWAVEYVGDRRWNLKLKSGAEVALPEENFSSSLDMLEKLQLDHRLLERPVARIDMRTPGFMIIRPLPEGDAAPNRV